jgi:protein SCO1/2
MSLKPDVEYRVLSVSFDETDTPELAAHRKKNYIAAMHNNFPPSGWRFLTGSKESIDRLMDELGYRFTRVDKDFVHPVAIIVTSPEGKIVRYLYGNNFLPFDTTMALTEAAEGKVGISLKRIVSYCFSYDPQGRRYALDIMRVAGFVVLFGVGILFLILSRGGRKPRK